jgi:hypothetical protein
MALSSLRSGAFFYKGEAFAVYARLLVRSRLCAAF